MVPHAYLGEVAAESLIVADVLCTTHAEVIGDIVDGEGVSGSLDGETLRLMTRFSFVECHESVVVHSFNRIETVVVNMIFRVDLSTDDS